MTTVPYRDLAGVIAAECRRLDYAAGDLHEAYAIRHGVTPDGAYRRLRRGRDAGTVTLDEADRWLVALNLTLDALPTPPVVQGEAPRRRRGGKPVGKYRRLTDTQVRACHHLYQQGLSVRQVAGQVWQRAGYTSPASCAESLYKAFVTLGLPRRDRIEAVKSRCTTHGLAPKHGPRPGYKTHKRRVLHGQQDQPPCEATTASGKPCRHRAMFGETLCVTHHPDHLATVEAALRLAWATPKPRGEAHPMAKLTEADVRVILGSSDPVRVLADRFGVSRDLIYRIRNGKLWRHITVEAEAA